MKKKEFKVEHSEQIKAQMENDPDLRKAMRELGATVRQAMAGVEGGQYKSFDDAMEAITGSRPQKVDVGEVPDEVTEAMREHNKGRKLH